MAPVTNVQLAFFNGVACEETSRTAPARTMPHHGAGGWSRGHQPCSCTFVLTIPVEIGDENGHIRSAVTALQWHVRPSRAGHRSRAAPTLHPQISRPNIDRDRVREVRASTCIELIWGHMELPLLTEIDSAWVFSTFCVLRIDSHAHAHARE